MELRALDLGWIREGADDPFDQCAHGRVQFQIGDTVFVRPEDGRWTLSAAGLYLLRTLQHEHTAANPVSESNFLIPCCGHAVWLNKPGRFEVICIGCNLGKNPDVVRRGQRVLVRAEQEETVSFAEWKKSVFTFVDQVSSFYQQCAPKIVPDDPVDREGWAAFWQEWQSRRQSQYD